MSTTPSPLRIVGLDAKRKAELATHAKRLGLTPQRYVKQLIEDGLAMEREARERTFDELLAPVRTATDMDEVSDVDALVDRARSRHQANARRSVKRKGRQFPLRTSRARQEAGLRLDSSTP